MTSEINIEEEKRGSIERMQILENSLSALSYMIKTYRKVISGECDDVSVQFAEDNLRQSLQLETEAKNLLEKEREIMRVLLGTNDSETFFPEEVKH